MTQNWVTDEVQYLVMGDARLNKRLSNILSNLSSDPKNSIPCANRTWTEIFGIYRFIENEKVNFNIAEELGTVVPHFRICVGASQ
ncbi:transposase [Microbulbifer sp. 2304DJ12-6]|uniref:IS4/Tn5 family transposase DNA-binding protein n=1 Tax=Microbulbifer sp. 2304DJ12-6 TaxID=3233340 RepID=UPI0039B09000